MVDFKYFINTDHFKIGHYGDKHVKRLNIALISSSAVVVITVIFYLIMYSFTNFSVLDDLQEYSEEYTKENVALDSIVMAAKIMPSYNFAKNAIWMEKTRDFNDTIIPGAEDMMEDMQLNNTYMVITNTEKFFPKFKYTSDNIPVGNSISYCISLHWASEEKGQTFELTDEVINFPECLEASTGKFMWNDDDPKNGIDVPAWIQNEHDIDCTDTEDCEATCDQLNALYLNGRRGKKCYSYQILESICLSVEYDSAYKQYKFAGGCFKDGKHYSMTSPVKNNIYYFDKVKFEVRNARDPVIKAGQLSNFTYSFGASMVSLTV